MSNIREVRVGGVNIGGGNPLVLIAGPCVIESEKMSVDVARKVSAICRRLGVGYIFKSSYLKSNRTAVENYVGPGLAGGLEILSRVRGETGVPVLSDVHCRQDVTLAAERLDMIQIPAYLCQQTDLMLAAARTARPLNIKKGQFLAPWDMKKICAKAESVGNRQILLTERGSVFGYNTLIWDVRSISVMHGIGYPVAVDVTHIIRVPGFSSRQKEGGQRQFIAPLARAAAAAGCDALFLEVHPDPAKALCDAASQLALKDLPELLETCLKLGKIASR